MFMSFFFLSLNLSSSFKGLIPLAKVPGT
jgi:hypothetical protein